MEASVAAQESIYHGKAEILEMLFQFKLSDNPDLESVWPLVTINWSKYAVVAYI